MAHAHTRTLLAKLGFGDKDRQNSRHDAACNYIALADGVLAKVIESALGPDYRVAKAKGVLEKLVQKGEGQYATTIGFIDVAASFDVGQVVEVTPYVSYECPPSDLEQLSAWRRRVDALVAEGRREIGLVKAMVLGSFSCIVEVKIGRVSSGDLIRQLKLYEEYHQMPHGTPVFRRPKQWPGEWSAPDDSGERSKKALWERCRRLKIAVVDYDVDHEYTSALKSEGIDIVRLGAGFERYLAEQSRPEQRVELAQI
jgi:hypothetical protein